MVRESLTSRSKYLTFLIAGLVAVAAVVSTPLFLTETADPEPSSSVPISPADPGSMNGITPTPVNSTNQFRAKVPRPVLHDPNLELQLVYTGLEFATQMDFIAQDDFLVLQKNDGKVFRINDCTLQSEPVLDLTVANLVERGLLGISIYNDTKADKVFAFIYYTDGREFDGDDATKGISADGNRLYRFELVNGTLDNEEALVYVSSERGASHNGGEVLIGPDNHVYFTVGDIASHKTRAQNFRNGSTAEGTSAILRVNQDGISPGAILGRDPPVNMYYAYGIRNSYGLDFDPVTGKLWDTENGPDYADEINLVEPGFNSGWRTVMGFSNSTGLNAETDLVHCLYCSSLTGYFDKWVNSKLFGIRDGTYSDPEFVWGLPVGVTAIKFMDSEKLGSQYLNDVFVADYVLGNIHRFELNEARNGFVLDGPLADKVADGWEELESVTFAQGFGAITDLQVGPDGYLYLISYGVNSSIYRIVPAGTPEPCSV